MAVELKTRWIGARFGNTKAIAIQLYATAIGLRLTDLVRIAIEEYMRTHPAPETPDE